MSLKVRQTGKGEVNIGKSLPSIRNTDACTLAVIIALAVQVPKPPFESFKNWHRFGCMSHSPPPETARQTNKAAKGNLEMDPFYLPERQKSIDNAIYCQDAGH
jgi:hypothetical protein